MPGAQRAKRASPRKAPPRSGLLRNESHSAEGRCDDLLPYLPSAIWRSPSAGAAIGGSCRGGLPICAASTPPLPHPKSQPPYISLAGGSVPRHPPLQSISAPACSCSLRPTRKPKHLDNRIPNTILFSCPRPAPEIPRLHPALLLLAAPRPLLRALSKVRCSAPSAPSKVRRTCQLHSPRTIRGAPARQLPFTRTIQGAPSPKLHAAHAPPRAKPVPSLFHFFSPSLRHFVSSLPRTLHHAPNASAQGLPQRIRVLSICVLRFAVCAFSPAHAPPRANRVLTSALPSAPLLPLFASNLSL